MPNDTTRLPRFSVHPMRPPVQGLGKPSQLKSRSGSRRAAKNQSPRILLLVPRYTRLREPCLADSAFQAAGIPEFEVMKRAGTPIGLVRIATTARRAGFDVRIVDAPYAGWEQESVYLNLPEGQLLQYGLTDEQILRIVREYDPDVVGIQCNYTAQWGNARALAGLLKAADPTLVVLGGGAHFSGDWKNALVDSPVDAIVINESDRSFVEILKALTMPDTDVASVRGVAYRQNGELINTNYTLGHNGRSVYVSINPERQDLVTRKEHMPLPDFGLLDMSLYQQPYHSSGARQRTYGAWAQTFASYGCSHQVFHT